MALCYAGELPTAAFGFNSAGVAFTLNSLPPLRAARGLAARNFVSRNLLGATGLDDALRRVTEPAQSVGHNYNLLGFVPGGFRAGSSAGGRRLVTVEVGPGGNTSSLAVGPGEAYFHANMFVRLPVPQAPGRTASSERRHRAAEARWHPPPASLGDALSVLGDPLIYSGDPPGGSTTLASCVFDLARRELYVLRGNPVEWGVANTFALPWLDPVQIPADPGVPVDAVRSSPEFLKAFGPDPIRRIRFGSDSGARAELEV